MDSHLQPIDDRSDGRHEPNTVGMRGALLTSFGFGLILVLVLLLMAGTFRALIVLNPAAGGRPTIVKQTDTMPGPRLNPDLPQQLQELRQLEDKRLSSYEWIDEKAGMASVPISRAMEILATKGLQPSEPKKEQRDHDNDK